jgi:hypothetical protein
MRVYHERLGVPLAWWLLGLVMILLLATELVAGFSWPLAVASYLVLTGGLVAMLVSWGRVSVVVTGTELRAGPARLPLAAVGEVTALDEPQTRALRGPRADPAAFLLIRPYLRRAVYVEVLRPGAVAGSRYWLVCSRHPDELAAALSGARATARGSGASMG